MLGQPYESTFKTLVTEGKSKNYYVFAIPIALELDMKNLDLEISSLTTEYDTVKSLISKNVEKTFTLFQS